MNPIQMTPEQELTLLRAENAKLKAKASQTRSNSLTVRVSPKGAISVYGLGKWPVTLYQEQMTRFLAASDDIKAFIEANKSVLTTKAKPEATV